MTAILLTYLAMVVLNRVVNWMNWWIANRAKGPMAYFGENAPRLVKTFILHVPVFALWYSGMLLPVINLAIKGAVAAYGATFGATIAPESVPTFTEVTPLVTVAAAWPLDSLASRLAPLFRRKPKPDENGEAV